MPRDFLLENYSASPQMENMPGRDFLAEPVKESLGTSAALALPRIGEDIIKSGYNFVKNVPQYFQAAKNEIPELFNTIQQHPLHTLSQIGAGIAESGQNIFNTPHDLANYATNRLNLIPENVNQKIQMARMPSNTETMINETFGKPQYPGEDLARGVGRNTLNILGAGGLTNIVNPLNLTAKSIAKRILESEKKQVDLHSKAYNKIWKDAARSGFDEVPADMNKLSNNLKIIEKYKTPREYQSLEDFILNPTLEAAQKAQSDMNIMHRKLSEKSRNGALTSEELMLYNAAKETEKNIENNMFKNSAGKINKKLQNNYADITKSYRENVVPYKYNSSIQAYKNKEILANELIKSLSHGEFAAKKGSFHPSIKVRNALNPDSAFKGIGILAGGKWLLDKLLGNNTTENES